VHNTLSILQCDGVKCNPPIWLKFWNCVVPVNTTNVSWGSLCDGQNLSKYLRSKLRNGRFLPGGGRKLNFHSLPVLKIAHFSTITILTIAQTAGRNFGCIALDHLISKFKPIRRVTLHTVALLVNRTYFFDVCPHYVCYTHCDI